VAVSEPTLARPTFREVAEDHLASTYRYLTHLVANRDLADDLTSATFERALKDWHRFDPGKGTPAVWLIQIARRVALDHFRSEGRRRSREESYAAGEARVADPPAEPSGDARLRAAIAALTRSERELVALRVVLELDSAETAEVVGGTPSAVSSGLHRALGKLRREMESRDEQA
jgi:RNA polymerase sigma-70 factor (ECF subfamily)